MSTSTSYSLWCINNSASSGNINVYQDLGNVTYQGSQTVQQLAWMVQGTNSGNQVRFDWELDYDIVWFDYGPPLTQGFKNTQMGNQVTLSKNSYGYQLSTPTAGTPGELSIVTDASIPASDKSVSGIGMNGAGTFASLNIPNVTTSYLPSNTQSLKYWVSFGGNFDVNQIVTPANMNAPQSVIFPYGVYTMTATYGIDGTWTVNDGPPKNNARIVSYINYEAGKGLITR